MDKWMQAVLNDFKARNPQFDEYRHEVEVMCPKCQRTGRLVSFVTANTGCVDGKAYCGHYCLGCRFDGATKRDCELIG